MSTNPLGRIRLVPSLTLVPVMVVALLTLGLWVVPSSTSALPATSSVAEVSILPTLTSDTLSSTDPIPESGPALTAAVWRMAIGQAVVDAGETKLGAPYVYSAGGPYAFDCSGFTRWAWMQLGVELPHNSGAQLAAVERIALDQLEPGDLVFNWGFRGGQPDHVGLYVGDGMMIHSPNSSGVVRYDPINWWTGATTAAGRVR
ncbi:MAG: C40 family peptidase [Actinomycetia bacterium]|nr:C40 family peptidase [Actinomycetes bacterium]